MWRIAIISCEETTALIKFSRSTKEEMSLIAKRELCGVKNVLDIDVTVRGDLIKDV